MTKFILVITFTLVSLLGASSVARAESNVVGADSKWSQPVSPAQAKGSEGTNAVGADSKWSERVSPAQAKWSEGIRVAIQNNNFNQVNIIAASNPEDQGAIALFLLSQSATYKNNPDMQVKIFKAATPFVGRIPAADVAAADEAITGMLTVAADKDFQVRHPQDASEIFLTALIMSNQPNVVANDPTLHSQVLEAADDFVKKNPSDADKKLLEEVSLAEAGGAPSVTPIGTINPSAN